MGPPCPGVRVRVVPDVAILRISRRSFRVSGSSPPSPESIRVRFAPSPTGNLHVGGARTALFNYLFARSHGGKFVLRIEDTDLHRSTKESEDALLRDLSWLGLHWDEGPDVGGEYGPYRQSERSALYKMYADKLLQSGHVYRCFCSDEELQKMKEVANMKKLPPVYSGKWATASESEIEHELLKGTPYTYRFRVPKMGALKIDDLIRGEVMWNLDTLGDFVVMRSNGQPVYNFCVTVDDSTMAISHVIRAEEHLPNTLRQALIYNALGFPMPTFAHVSLILAPDRSKLSKRHGATSVSQFEDTGFLPQPIVNYLCHTENETFSLDELVSKFTIERVNKSGAVFDLAKLKWMNGRHLRSLPTKELTRFVSERWKNSCIVEEAIHLLKDKINVTTDLDESISNLLSYPLYSTLASPECRVMLVGDKLSQVATRLIAAYDNGEFISALKEGRSGWQKWVEGFGKSSMMPLRVLLTGKVRGPDMCEGLLLIYKAGKCGGVERHSGFVPLDERFKILRQVNWDSLNKD